MWFNHKKNSDSKTIAEKNCKSQLASIQSNGVTLSMVELLNYQNKTALIDLSSRKNIRGQMSGNYLSRSKGRGMEFDEVRHYQTGDDIRAIDWRVTARTGKTHTKLFREELERPVLIATDLSTSMHFGTQLLFKSIQAAHIASLIAWHAKNRGDRLGGIVFNQQEHIELKPRSRKEGVLHYLHALNSIHDSQHNNQYCSEIQECDEQSNSNKSNYFTNNCARIRQVAKPGSLVYLITDAQQLKNVKDINQHDALRHLTQISQHCELVVCLVKDPLEQTLPNSNIKLNVALTDGVNRKQLTLGDLDTATTYQEYAKKINSLCEKSLTNSGARVIEISAGETLEEQLKKGSKLCQI